MSAGSLSAGASAGSLLDAGLVGLESALAEVASLRDESGARVLRVRLLDGWSFDVLPDRGLDIGAAWFAGRPVAWRSVIEDDPGAGFGWDRRFLGGLVVTCGPDVIGPAPGATVSIDAARWEIREPVSEVPGPSTLPASVLSRTVEAVFEHHGVASGSDGLARAAVATPDGATTTVEWSAASLPRLFQWVLPTRGGWALGIEPATAPLFGPERDLEHRGAPLLAPGAVDEHTVVVRHVPAAS